MEINILDNHCSDIGIIHLHQLKFHLTLFSEMELLLSKAISLGLVLQGNRLSHHLWHRRPIMQVPVSVSTALIPSLLFANASAKATEGGLSVTRPRWSSFSGFLSLVSCSPCHHGHLQSKPVNGRFLSLTLCLSNK